MPVVNSTQARIELSADQADALANMIMDIKQDEMPPMIFIEETNLNGVVVVGGKGMPTTLLHWQGTIVSKAWLAIQPAEDALKLSHSKGDFEGRVFKTRPCTYCFKASWLPGENPDDKR
jgi:hypothetical protein